MKREILKLAVVRDGSGCYVRIKSDVPFVSLCQPTGGTVSGVMVRTPRPNILPLGAKTELRPDLFPLTFTDGSFNAIFLFADNLSSGVEFKIDAPVSLNEMEAFAAKLRSLAVELYKKHFSPALVESTVFEISNRTIQ